MNLPRSRRPPRLDPDLVDEPLLTLEPGTEVAGRHVTAVSDDPAGARAEVIGCRFSGVWLIGADLEGIRVVDTVFERCDLSTALLTRATLMRVSFVDCRLAGTGIADATLTDVRFDDCRMAGLDLRMSRTDHLELQDCDLPEADFYAAGLAGARVIGCNLSGAECSQSSWEGAQLHGSTLTHVKGAIAFRGVSIGTDQIIPLALGMFADLGVTVDDDLPA